MSQLWRNSDPETSKAAPSDATGRATIRNHIQKIFAYCEQLSDETLIAIYERDIFEGKAPFATPSGIRSRRNELTQEGFLRDSGRRMLTKSNRKAIIWEIQND